MDDTDALQERIVRMIEKYTPDRINETNEILSKYAGHEAKLLDAYRKKYGPEPNDIDDATPEDLQKRIAAMVTKYQPDKVSTIDAQLKKYAGKEKTVLRNMIKKLGPEPDRPGTRKRAPSVASGGDNAPAGRMRKASVLDRPQPLPAEPLEDIPKRLLAFKKHAVAVRLVDKICQDKSARCRRVLVVTPYSIFLCDADGTVKRSLPCAQVERFNMAMGNKGELVVACVCEGQPDLVFACTPYSENTSNDPNGLIKIMTKAVLGASLPGTKRPSQLCVQVPNVKKLLDECTMWTVKDKESQPKEEFAAVAAKHDSEVEGAARSRSSSVKSSAAPPPYVPPPALEAASATPDAAGRTGPAAASSGSPPGELPPSSDGTAPTAHTTAASPAPQVTDGAGAAEEPSADSPPRRVTFDGANNKQDDGRGPGAKTEAGGHPQHAADDAHAQQAPAAQDAAPLNEQPAAVPSQSTVPPGRVTPENASSSTVPVQNLPPSPDVPDGGPLLPAATSEPVGGHGYTPGAQAVPDVQWTPAKHAEAPRSVQHVPMSIPSPPKPVSTVATQADAPVAPPAASGTQQAADVTVDTGVQADSSGPTAAWRNDSFPQLHFDGITAPPAAPTPPRMAPPRQVDAPLPVSKLIAQSPRRSPFRGASRHQPSFAATPRSPRPIHAVNGVASPAIMFKRHVVARREGDARGVPSSPAAAAAPAPAPPESAHSLSASDAGPRSALATPPQQVAPRRFTPPPSPSSNTFATALAKRPQAPQFAEVEVDSMLPTLPTYPADEATWAELGAAVQRISKRDRTNLDGAASLALPARFWRDLRLALPRLDPFCEESTHGSVTLKMPGEQHDGAATALVVDKAILAAFRDYWLEEHCYIANAACVELDFDASLVVGANVATSVLGLLNDEGAVARGGESRVGISLAREGATVATGEVSVTAWQSFVVGVNGRLLDAL